MTHTEPATSNIAGFGFARRYDTILAVSTTAAVRVPGSTSNIGAGFDCLGLALNLWLEAKIVEGSGDPEYSGTLTGLNFDSDLIFAVLGGAVPPGYQLQVHSEIPTGRGLGASAAAAVAGLALARLLVNEPLDRDAIFEAAREIEGHPDNAAPAVFGGLVLSGDQPIPLTVSKHLGISLAVPAKPVSTKAARDILPKLISRDVAVDQASRAAALSLGLSSGDGDLIRYGMEDRIAVPHRSHLIPGYYEAVNAGLEAGAYGVTISGSGSTVIAITRKKSAKAVAQVLADTLTEAGNKAEALAPRVIHTGFETIED